MLNEIVYLLVFACICLQGYNIGLGVGPTTTEKIKQD